MSEELELLLDAQDALRCIENNEMPTRRQSEAAWRAVKEGLLTNDEVLRWASFIATAVVEEVIDSDCSAQDKPHHALRAIKIVGKDAKADSRLETEAVFWRLGEALKPSQNASLRSRAKSLKRIKEFEHLTIGALTEQLRRLTR
jgi:hypothetical protein